MAGVYNYLKVAKLKFLDSSSNLIIDPSGSQLVAFKATNITAEKIVTDVLNWNNAYIPDPSNHNVLIPVTNHDFGAGNLKVNGNTSFTQSVNTGSLDISGNLTGGPLVTHTLTSSSVQVNGNLITTGKVDDLSIHNISGKIVVDLSGNNIYSALLNVDGNSIILGGLNVNSLNTNQNMSVQQNLAIIQNKSVSNDVYIGNNFQMTDASSNVVSLNGTQLAALLALI